ncbi:peptidylprolyl isomerase, partial [Acinetobacter baumannii]
DLALSRLRQQAVNSRIQISDQDVKNFLNTPQGQALLGSQVHVLHLRITGENAQQIAAQVRNDLSSSNDIQAISKKYSTGDIKVAASDMG